VFKIRSAKPSYKNLQTRLAPILTEPHSEVSVRTPPTEGICKKRTAR